MALFMIRGALWVLLMAVVTGILMMWIMVPTKTYRNHWLPRIRKEVNNTTYIGTQGTTLLMYTFPALFVAVLSCLYLHLINKLEKKSATRNGVVKPKKEVLAQWKRPVLVKGPLGIVSGIELTFFLMFIALLVWSFSTYLQNKFPTITKASATKDGVKVWEDKLGAACLYLGITGNIAVSFLFYPVTRGSSVLPMLGVTSEASIKYHIWLGHIAMTLLTAHGLCFIIFWAITNEISEMIKWEMTGVSNVAGELSLLSGLVLWSTTFPRVRRKMFEVFYYTHHLYLLFVLFFILHVGISYAFIMLPGFYLFLVDRYLRFLQSRRHVRLLSARVLPAGDTLELNFSKAPGLKYNPASTMFVNVPSISKLQWHPFTVTSNSSLEPDRLSVVIKNQGSWSGKLCHIFSTPNSSIDRLDVSVEGPYGPVSSHFLRHDTIVMVSGGSGITPFFSIIREFIYLSNSELELKTPQLILVCAFKTSADLAMLNLLLPISGTPSSSDLSNLQVQIEAYVTRETEQHHTRVDMDMDMEGEGDYTAKHQIRTVWLKPNPTDEPVSAILGRNSWLWLGAVIASSFVMFLLLMGIITRYYIYPIDHNTNKSFSSSTKAVLHILVMCVSIAAAGSTGVLANKKRNARDGKQIQNLEGPPTPAAAASPLGVYDGAGDVVELESLPHQSVAQATNVHYGARPDLRRLLLECKGSSVGVLVCGPKKLRHDVAAICASGLADNLHFESISFSW